MKKILITGSSGRLGSYLIDNLKKYFKVYHLGKTERSIDLSNLKSVTTYLINLKPDIIINCASLTDIEICQYDKKKSKKINFDIVKNILDVKKKHKLHFKLIQISTDHMYDSKNFFKNHERSKPIINNTYTEHKLAAEKICIKTKSLVLRVNFFGLSKNRNRPTLSDFLYKSARLKKHLNLFNDVYFSPLSLKTLTIILKKIILKKNIYGLFNIGSKKGLSKKEFALLLLSKFKNLKFRNISVDSVSLTKRSKNMKMNVNKFERIFKISLPDLKKEIKKEVTNYEKNYNK
tara:strand:+ start:5775 stop:6644 length:870 start_codon:yes stop_codon:yes gene_type:complete